MLSRQQYVVTDPVWVKDLIRKNPWATFVSPTSNGLVASHYPVLVDEETEDLTIVSHFGRNDDEFHELGSHEIVVIIQGPHGYVSPSWYAAGEDIPTWDHVTAHLYGTPELVSDDENYSVLTRLVDLFESRMPQPRSLSTNEEFSRAVARATAGFRMTVSRFEARAKLSQDKTPEALDTIVDGLRGNGPYAQPALADEVERAR